MKQNKYSKKVRDGLGFDECLNLKLMLTRKIAYTMGMWAHQRKLFNFNVDCLSFNYG